jgi:hypothetical protein
VEWAAGLIVGATSLECDVVTNNINDIDGCKYSVYGFTINHSCKDTKKSMNYEHQAKKKRIQENTFEQKATLIKK